MDAPGSTTSPDRRWPGLPAGSRGRRRLVWAAALGFVVVAAGAQQAPYAVVTPGPTPDLSAAVAAAQTPAGVPGTSGRFLATTVNASPLTWFGTARCAATSRCSMLPVDTSDSATQERTDREMVQSQRDAANAARAQVGASGAGSSVHLHADLEGIGGPSAGLMLTLSFMDALGSGDLAGGRVVAGTGTIDPSGSVGPVGGITQKVRGAAAADADVFFAPMAEAAQASSAARGAVRVVAVSTVTEAARWLCDHPRGEGHRDAVCPQPGR